MAHFSVSDVVALNTYLQEEGSREFRLEAILEPVFGTGREIGLGTVNDPGK